MRILTRFSRPLGLLVAMALLAPSGPAKSQVIRGFLLESESRTPVAGGWLSLLDTTFSVVTGTESGRDGSFIIQTPGPGDFYVLAEALGYHPAIDGILEMGEGGFITIEFLVRPKPLVLEEILVAVERVRAYEKLSTAGFYQRRQQGFGHQLDPIEIRELDPVSYEDVLRGIPGVRLTAGANGGSVPLFIPGGYCTPQVWVDGARVNIQYGGLESVVDVESLTAVEAYTHTSSLPLQYGGSDSACGALIIWTK